MPRNWLSLLLGASLGRAFEEDVSLMQMLVTSEGDMDELHGATDDKEAASCSSWLVENGLAFVQQQFADAEISRELEDLTGDSTSVPSPVQVASVCADIASYIDSTEWSDSPCKNDAGVTKQCEKSFSPTCNFVAKSLRSFAQGLQQKLGSEFKSALNSWEAVKGEKKTTAKKYKAAEKDFKKAATTIEKDVSNNCKAAGKLLKSKGKKSGKKGRGKDSDEVESSDPSFFETVSNLREEYNKAGETIEAASDTMRQIITEISPPGDDSSAVAGATTDPNDQTNRMTNGEVSDLATGIPFGP